MVAMVLGAGPRDLHIGLLFPPWTDVGEVVTRVAALNLPVLDIQAGGRLIVVLRDPEANPSTARELAAATGAIAITLRSTAFCARPLSTESPVQ